MSLQEKQTNFVWMVGKLIAFAYEEGYEITFGETYRPLREAQADGFSKSLHSLRLAIDLNLFIEGRYQTDSDAYEELGTKWESLGGSWGGRFAKPDGNHFSLEHEGIR